VKKRPDGITLISVYHFLMAAVALMGFLAIMAIPVVVGISTLAAEVQDAHIPIAVTGVLFLVVGLVVLVVGALNLVLGIALWNLRPWSRIAVIILAAFRLFNFPLGTAVGGLTIWYLLQPDVEALFVEQ
jgi:hypothetical protein